MSEYWTKERFMDIGLAAITIFSMIFVYMVFLAWINKDLSWNTVIISAQLAIGLDLLAMCVGGMGALLKVFAEDTIKTNNFGDELMWHVFVRSTWQSLDEPEDK
jgi:hypothetical protein